MKILVPILAFFAFTETVYALKIGVRELDPPTQCHPKCNWRTPPRECEMKCTPRCHPPTCKTRCRNPDMNNVQIQCLPPVCTTVCDDSCSETGPQTIDACPPCRAACDKPNCTMVLAQPPKDCMVQCSKPVCDWNCTEPSSQECPKPESVLECEEPDCQGFAFPTPPTGYHDVPAWHAEPTAPPLAPYAAVARPNGWPGSIVQAPYLTRAAGGSFVVIRDPSAITPEVQVLSQTSSAASTLRGNTSIELVVRKVQQEGPVALRLEATPQFSTGCEFRGGGCGEWLLAAPAFDIEVAKDESRHAFLAH